MIVKSDQARGPCDNMCGNNAAYGVVQQGATGRYCEVMWICYGCAVKWAGGVDNILTAQEGRDECDKDPHGYPDF